MNERLKKSHELALGGLMMSLAFILPIAFHAIGLGKVFLPMFLPIFVAGFLLSWRTALAAGFFTPIISSLFTGMPPLLPPIAPMMMIELAVLGAVTSLCYRSFRWNIWVTLFSAIVVTRIVGFFLHFFLAVFFALPGVAWGVVTLVSGLPGLALQIITVPAIVTMIERRYPIFKPQEREND